MGVGFLANYTNRLIKLSGIYKYVITHPLSSHNSFERSLTVVTTAPGPQY